MPVNKQLPGIGLDLTSIGGKDNSKVDLTGVANNIKSITEQADKEMNALKQAEQDIIKATAEAEKLIKEPVKTGGTGGG